MPLNRCTLTGVDDNTSNKALVDISDEFPFVEWGLLYSPRQCGHARYASVKKLHEVIALSPENTHVALHVCGRGVPEMLMDEPVVHGLVCALAQRGGRLQLNFNLTHRKVDADGIETLINRFDMLDVIVQRNVYNEPSWPRFNANPNCFGLFDASGGRGILSDGWPSIEQGARCGYAGGLGPQNVLDQLPAIAGAAGANNYWIDMEGSLRNDSDAFDLVRCIQTLALLEPKVI